MKFHHHHPRILIAAVLMGGAAAAAAVHGTLNNNNEEPPPIRKNTDNVDAIKEKYSRPRDNNVHNKQQRRNIMIVSSEEEETSSSTSEETTVRRVWVHNHPGKHQECVRKIQQMASDHSTHLELKYDFPNVQAMVITATDAEIENLLKQDPNNIIKSIVDDPKRYFHHHTHTTSSSLLRKKKRNNNNKRDLLSWNGQAISYGIELVQAVEAKDSIGLTGQGVTVCVIDSGLDINHEDFDSTSYTGDSLDSSNNSSLLSWSTDESGHGTHVTGIISMSDNDIGLVGIAPRAHIHIVKVFDDFGSFVYSSALVDAAYKCRDANANIITMSLGGDYQLEEEKIVFTDLYVNHGILSIASAGNDGSNSHSYPASYNHVLSVGAVDRTKNIAYFSQYNEKIDLVAPGVDIWSALPQNFNCDICAEKATNLGYASVDGTSQAAPHVAGVAALLWSYDTTTISVAHIWNALLASAEDLGDVGRDNYYGQGLVAAASAFDILNATLNGTRPLEDWTSIESSTGGGNAAIPTDAIIPDCSDNEILFTIDLKTDRYGNETAWEVVRDVDDFTVMAGAGYGNRKQTQASQCLPNNCYTFTVVDAFGDGICCGFGNGTLNVTVDGERILSASNFTDSESISFGDECIALSNDPKPELPACLDVTLTLLTDDFPQETTVSLEDLDLGTVFWNDEVFSLESSTYTLTKCINPTGCHRFEITDDASDGICCEYGSGSFVLSYDGDVVLSGDAFGASEVHLLGDNCANQA